MGWLKRSVKPILTRYYLWSSKWFGVKLHHIKQSDPEWHTHPWWGISFIWGMYYEQRDYDVGIKRRLFFNLISPWRPHRILVTKPVWTLFIHGPRVNERWRYGNEEAPWRGPDSEINGMFLAADKRAGHLAKTHLFVPSFVVFDGDYYWIEDNRYYLFDKNDKLLASGKVILKS